MSTLSPVEVEVRALPNPMLAAEIERVNRLSGEWRSAVIAEAARRLRWTDAYMTHATDT